MPHYIALLNFTDQGVKTFRDSVDRAARAGETFGSRGVTLVDTYWTIGPYDVVVHVEAADDETLTAALLGLASQGNVRTTTMRAFTADEMRQVIAQAG